MSDQLQLFDSLATALVYTGPEKVHIMVYLSGAFKSALKNELNAHYPNVHRRTADGFSRALLAAWSRFCGETDCERED